jgi:hypothetical protein
MAPSTKLPHAVLSCKAGHASFLFKEFSSILHCTRRLLVCNNHELFRSESLLLAFHLQLKLYWCIYPREPEMLPEPNQSNCLVQVTATVFQ